jgi:glutamate synthase domain-containing protein 1
VCGIAGILYKADGLDGALGRDLITMLDGCQHRGPDSTGFALYHETNGAAANGSSTLRLRFFVGDGDEAEEALARIHAQLEEHAATVVEEHRVGTTVQLTVRFDGDLRSFSYAMEHAAKLASIGESLDIVKDVGGAHDVDDVYHVGDFTGTHGIGHVRLATESDVSPEAGHPFWATGFADVAIVHNGQITNYWKMRRRLEKRGFEFHTDNDSELIAVYLADKLEQGIPLAEALESSIRDLDGTFSFLVSTKDEIGYAKDRLAAKPMVMYEDDDIVAIASEEVSLNRLFPGRSLVTTEPAPGTYRTWRRST